MTLIMNLDHGVLIFQNLYSYKYNRSLYIHLMSESLFYFKIVNSTTSGSQWKVKCPGGGGGEVLPYVGYIGMCGPKGNRFLAVLV